MKAIKKIVAVLALGSLLAALAGCGAGDSEAAPPADEAVTVAPGDITVDITAAGNLALSRTEDLPIDLFYQEGTVAEVLVEEGDSVTEGQVLVKLDTDEWDDELSDLEDAITAQERALLQAQVNLQTSQQSLKDARDNVSVKELAVLNKQIALDEADTTLRTGIAAVDFDAADAQLRRAQSWYDYLKGAGKDAVSADDYLLALQRAWDSLQAAQTEYDNILSGYDSNDINLKKNQVKAAQMSLAQAEEDLTDVNADVSLKENQVKLNEGKVADAQKALVDARDAFSEAQSKSPEIKAPFDGFVTKVNVEGGDDVLKGTIAVQIADPEKFEADILVSEMDIMQVKLGGQGWVEVDAVPGIKLPATVTHISPTATIQSGVVNYRVKVELQPLPAVMAGTAAPAARPDFAAGELPAPLQQAIDEGRLTREQVNEMIRQRQAAGGGPPGAGQFGGGARAGAARPATTAAMEDFQMREGLTVTVSLVIDQKTGVLVVPSAAIKNQSGQPQVRVLKADGTTETRTIETGITDYQMTEVTGGLSEGEQVLVSQGTATPAAAMPQQSGPPRMFFGGPPR